MTDSIRIVHDTIFIKGADAYDILVKTDTMYNNAWAKLVWLMGVIFGFVGLAVPFYIQYLQRQQFKEALANQKKEIKADIDLAQIDLKNAADAQIGIHLAKYKVDVEEMLNLTNGKIHFNTSVDDFNADNKVSCIEQICQCLKYYCLVKYNSDLILDIEKLLEVLAYVLASSTENEIQEVNNDRYKRFQYFKSETLPLLKTIWRKNSSIMTYIDTIEEVLTFDKFNKL